MDTESLTPSQRNALDQLQTLTAGGDPEVAIGVLSSVDWDVQVCQRFCLSFRRTLSPRFVWKKKFIMSRPCRLTA